MTPRDKPVSRGKNKGNISETTNNAFIEIKHIQNIIQKISLKFQTQTNLIESTPPKNP